MSECSPRRFALSRWLIAIAIAGYALKSLWDEYSVPTIPPLAVVLRVVDEKGAPIPHAEVKVTQAIDIGTKLFCVSIPTFGSGGRNCTKYKDVRIFRGRVDANGEQSLTVRYADMLLIEAATACVSDPPGAYPRRSHFSALIPWDSVVHARTIVLGSAVGSTSSLCEVGTPPDFIR